MKSQFFQGVKDGVPISLGYFSVSFGFGILVVGLGLSIAAAVGISLTNLTSAGQVAGVGVIAAGGTLLEMALTQFVINLRYSLMGIALSQKLDRSFHAPQRLIVAFGITDEIFAVASSRKEPVTPRYMYGLILISAAGWVLGTLLGAAAGHVLPTILTDAMGIVLYGMFLAVIIPPARESRGVLSVVLLAAACSIVFEFALPVVSDGFAIILSGILAAVAGAVFFPVKEEAAQEGEVSAP